MSSSWSETSTEHGKLLLKHYNWARRCGDSKVELASGVLPSVRFRQTPFCRGSNRVSSGLKEPIDWVFFSWNTPRTGFRSYESRDEHKSANQRATQKLLVVQPVVHFFKERERERERAMGSLKKELHALYSRVHAHTHTFLDPKVKARAHWYFINSHPNCHMVKLPVLATLIS